MSDSPDHVAELDEVASLSLKPQLPGAFAGLVLRRWTRGGPPGAGYFSDQLEIEVLPSRGDQSQGGHESPAKSINANYLRTRFDLAFHPPFRVLRYDKQLTWEQIKKILHSLANGDVFRRTHPQETVSEVMDGLKETWTLKYGDREWTKTFYEPLPESAAALALPCNRIDDYLVQAGTPSDLSKSPK